MFVFEWFRGARRWGWILMVCIMGVACAHSPQDELQKARAQLATLERSEAGLYLPAEMQEIRALLQRAENRLRTNQFLLAEEDIREGLMRLRQVAIQFDARREQAKQQSEAFVRELAFRLTECRQYLGNLPRITYVDQNRYDVIRMRLQQLERHYARLRQCLEAGQYLTILKERQRVQQKLNTVIDLLEQGRQSSRRVAHVEYDRSAETEPPAQPEPETALASQR